MVDARTEELAGGVINGLDEGADVRAVIVRRSELCRLLPDEDPVLVRVAAYAMLHSGTASCADIATRELGPASLLELT